jgi:hypothetical protein
VWSVNPPLSAQILPQIGLISTGLLSMKSHSESTIFPRFTAIRGLKIHPRRNGMLRRVAIGASLLFLLAGTAYAQEGGAPAPAAEEAAPAVGEEGEGEGDACSQALAATEESVRDKLESGSMSDADTEKVNELLDQADAQCTEGDMEGATTTLDQVKSMVAKAQ